MIMEMKNKTTLAVIYGNDLESAIKVINKRRESKILIEEIDLNNLKVYKYILHWDTDHTAKEIVLEIYYEMEAIDSDNLFPEETDDGWFIDILDLDDDDDDDDGYDPFTDYDDDPFIQQAHNQWLQDAIDRA